jgi:MarR-like DNA-binding transcriptional regulator SgrR of sgrS sRNA
MATWSFLTNHALVLMYVGRHPEGTGLEIAQAVGITERAVRKILAELQGEAYVETERIGRGNRYRVDVHRPLRRVGERELTVGELLAMIPAGQGASAWDGSSSGRRPANLAPPMRGGANS